MIVTSKTPDSIFIYITFFVKSNSHIKSGNAPKPITYHLTTKPNKYIYLHTAHTFTSFDESRGNTYAAPTSMCMISAKSMICGVILFCRHVKYTNSQSYDDLIFFLTFQSKLTSSVIDFAPDSHMGCYIFFMDVCSFVSGGDISNLILLN